LSAVTNLRGHRGGSEQTWQCKTTPTRVLMVHDDESLVFDAASWERAVPG
jgi:hypothetical protein